MAKAWLDPWRRLARAVTTYESKAHQDYGIVEGDTNELTRTVRLAQEKGPSPRWALSLHSEDRILREWSLPYSLSTIDAKKAAERLISGWGISDEEVDPQVGQEMAAMANDENGEGLVEFVDYDNIDAVEFGAGDVIETGYNDNVVDRILVGSWGGFWKKFKGVFKTVYKKLAKSDMAKQALNNVSPGAGDAMQKGMQLIDSAASGNPAALAQVKGIADAAKAGKEEAQGAHDLLKTVNEARKEVKAETVTAAVGATMDAGIQSLIGRHLRVTDKGGGKEVTVVMKITAVHPEAHVQVEIVGMPGNRQWEPLEKIYRAILEKEAVWTDEKGTPVVVGGGGGGFHHGGFHGGMMMMDPRDMYWGPRVDIDDAGNPVFVGHHHGGGGFRGWGGMAYPPWGGMWYPPMWEEVEFVTEEEAAAQDDAAAKTKGPRKVVVPEVGGGGGGFHHHGMAPGGVMMGPGWGTYEPYPYPGADPWMFEEIEYQNEAMAEPDEEPAAGPADKAKK